jgi:hypothetical protein
VSGAKRVPKCVPNAAFLTRTQTTSEHPKALHIGLPHLAGATCNEEVFGSSPKAGLGLARCGMGAGSETTSREKIRMRLRREVCVLSRKMLVMFD